MAGHSLLCLPVFLFLVSVFSAFLVFFFNLFYLFRLCSRSLFPPSFNFVYVIKWFSIFSYIKVLSSLFIISLWILS